ncbi:MAG: hypothetical protein OEY03_14030, partial [Rhizobacter sp.]|nr:hypothetical protein [Rhizobacter sp.]
NGRELRRMPATTVLQRIATGGKRTLAQVPAADPAGGLDSGRSYQALRALYPRSWLPAVMLDRGLQAFGAGTFGTDALNWHQYAATAQWETSQRELLGSLEYLFIGQHHVALGRSLKATAWDTSGNEDRTTAYERRTQAQWLSAFPLVKLRRTLLFGVGAAIDRIEQVQLVNPGTARTRDEKIAAALVELDTGGVNWWSEGPNRGQRSTLLVETYKPFARDDGSSYDGTVARLDLRGYLPVGRSVLAARHTEVHARGRTEPFQLGGAVDVQLQLGLALNDREIALRGYRGDEPELLGANARVTTVEWRMPLADVDRHAMSPPIGLNRLSAATFFDIGGAWASGRRPNQYYRGVGVELLGEVKLLYALGLRLRAGVAFGLDEPGGARGYLSLGRMF